MGSITSDTSTGPMPSATLPSGAGGGPGFQGGQLGHRLAGRAPASAPSSDTSLQDAESAVLPKEAQGSSTFARTVYRPAYWRQWTVEAEDATAIALKEMRERDAANQRARMRRVRRQKPAFSESTATGPRYARATGMGFADRFPERPPPYNSLHYSGHGSLSKTGASQACVSVSVSVRVRLCVRLCVCVCLCVCVFVLCVC